jgi:acetyl-CoA C-acetyltransferase
MAGPAHSLHPRLPVLVGLGTANHAAPVVELMTAAIRAAANDAGAPEILRAIDCIVVPQGTWSLLDPARAVAQRIGARRARSVRCEIGVSQQEAINFALRAVTAGTADVVVVAGAEARAWERGGGVESESDDADAPPDDVLSRPPDFVAPVEIAAGIVMPPVQQYAMIENALGVAEGLSTEAQSDEIAQLWAGFNSVAQTNPDAAFAEPRTAIDIATPGPRNRPLAFPYNLRHSSQWTVDQSSALVICSAERATAAGIPLDRWLFPHVALHCSQAVTLTARRHLEAWPGMEVLGRAAAAAVARPLAEIELVEVYSCFPSAVRVQQRALGLPRDRAPTLTGGMAFAGGPFNHFVLMAHAALGQQLRAHGTELGLVTTVSGMLSKPGLAIWSATPPTGAPLVADLGDEAAAATAVVPVAPSPPTTPSAGCVVSFTVTYGGDDGLEPVRAAIVADLPDGVRTAATCEDATTARLAVTDGLIGRTVEVKDTTFSL